MVLAGSGDEANQNKTKKIEPIFVYKKEQIFFFRVFATKFHISS